MMLWSKPGTLELGEGKGAARIKVGKRKGLSDDPVLYVNACVPVRPLQGHYCCCCCHLQSAKSAIPRGLAPGRLAPLVVMAASRITQKTHIPGTAEIFKGTAPFECRPTSSP